MHWGRCYISILVEHPDAHGQKQTKAPFCRLAGTLKTVRKLKITQRAKVATTNSPQTHPELICANRTVTPMFPLSEAETMACSKPVAVSNPPRLEKSQETIVAAVPAARPLHDFAAATIRLLPSQEVRYMRQGETVSHAQIYPHYTKKCYRTTLTPIQHYAKVIKSSKFFAVTLKPSEKILK
jgi:hypothetical protein